MNDTNLCRRLFALALLAAINVTVRAQDAVPANPLALDAAAIQRLGVGRRSTVVALPAAMVLGEALRQTHHHETLA